MELILATSEGPAPSWYNIFGGSHRAATKVAAGLMKLGGAIARGPMSSGSWARRHGGCAILLREARFETAATRSTRSQKAVALAEGAPDEHPGRIARHAWSSGITGREGEFHTRAPSPTDTARRGGHPSRQGRPAAIDGTVPIFDTVAEAVSQAGANTSVIYIPAGGARTRILEAVDAGIGTIVCDHGGHSRARHDPGGRGSSASRARLIGPNLPRRHLARLAKVGIIPASIHNRAASASVPLRDAHL